GAGGLCMKSEQVKIITIMAKPKASTRKNENRLLRKRSLKKESDAMGLLILHTFQVEG
ncbi:MAG: hypothetical protein JWO53_293, partial [Chlamydiia bacterium]|nr:hypothetical protein [Chlamydiia bacterium]